jgi:hypothetical protein
MRKASAFDLAGLRRAGEGLGQSFVPFGTFTSRFGPGRHDGPNAARYVQFSSECGCFSYVGGLLDLG